MASVVIQGDTSGSVTLQAPAVAGSTTVNLPSTIGNAGASAVVTTDASGNLGLGVTPSAWGSGRLAFQIAGSAANYFMGANANSLVFGSNFFSDGTNNKYIANGFASAYIQASSQHLWYTAASGTAGNAISFTQAMTLDANGRLGLGVTSPQVEMQVYGSSVSRIQVQNATSGVTHTDGVQFAISGSDGYLWNFENGAMIFGINNAERGRFTTAGYFKASSDGTYYDATAQYHELKQTNAGDVAVVVNANNASYTGPGALFVDVKRNTTNNTFYAISYYNNTAAAYRFRVADSGNCTNTNGSYGTISDVKMKTDIVDAGSQWDDIKAVRFRKFKMKDDPDQIVQLGVVAQELEQTSPGLVEEHKDTDKDGNDLGTTTKSVKTSVLLMKAAVALQEAMLRIENLETEIAALKAAGSN